MDYPLSVVAEKYIYVLNPVKELPGSLTVPAGPFLPGEEIEITVNKPEPLEDYLESFWAIGAYQRGTRLSDGSLILPRGGEQSVVVDEPGTSVHRLTLPTRPGRHEILVQDEAGFVIDRKPIEIEVALPEVRLALTGDQVVSAGGSTSIDADGVFFAMPYLSFEIANLSSGARETWRHIESINYPGPSDAPKEVPSIAIEHPPLLVQTWYPGLQRVVAGWNPRDHDFGPIQAGILDLPVLASSNYPRPSGILLSQDGVFFPGEPVDISLDELPFRLPPSSEVRIYRLATGAVVQPRQAFTAGAEPVAVQPVDGSPSRTAISAALEPGDYEVVLVSAPADGGEPSALIDQIITVLPPEEAFAVTVNSGGPVHAYAPYTIEARIPEPFAMEDQRFFVQLVHLGGSLADCRTVMERLAFSRSVGEGSSGQIAVGDWDGLSGTLDRPLRAPGEYAARLYFGSSGYEHNAGLWPNATLLASSRFEVSYQAAPNALVLETSDPDDKMEVSYRVDLPASFQGVDRESVEVSLVRQPEHARSGAERFPPPAYDGRYASGQRLPRPDKPQSVTVGPLVPGAYELSLSQLGFCFLGDCRRILLDRLPFEVRQAGWKGPARLVPAPSDMAPERLDPDGFARLDPPGACGGDGGETMVLSFSRLLGGKPVPLQGPIDYGYPFFIEGRLEAPARQQVYRVLLETPSGIRRTVALYPVPDDPTLLRSELTYVMWDIGAIAAPEPSREGSP
jgi:hypothetical protein